MPLKGVIIAKTISFSVNQGWFCFETSAVFMFHQERLRTTRVKMRRLDNSVVEKHSEMALSMLVICIVQCNAQTSAN